MATRPTLHRAIEKTKNTASDYNDNFDLMMDFIDDTLDECKDYVDDFMPSVAGQTGKFLTNNGTEASWDVAVPVGTIFYYGDNTAPTGWFVCDGSAISRITYAALFSAIGTTYGEGDESTTFNLPDLINKFPQGGTTVGTVKDAGLPNITGRCDGIGQPPYINNPQGAFTNVGRGDGRAKVEGGTGYYYNFDASRVSSVYKNDVTTVQPPALTLLPIIKY